MGRPPGFQPPRLPWGRSSWTPPRGQFSRLGIHLSPPCRTWTGGIDRVRLTLGHGLVARADGGSPPAAGGVAPGDPPSWTPGAELHPGGPDGGGVTLFTRSFRWPCSAGPRQVPSRRRRHGTTPTSAGGPSSTRWRPGPPSVRHLALPGGRGAADRSGRRALSGLRPPGSTGTWVVVSVYGPTGWRGSLPAPGLSAPWGLDHPDFLRFGGVGLGGPQGLGSGPGSG